MLRASPFQARVITEEMAEKMAESLARVGQLHAIAARQITDGLYEICGGHCRHAGAVLAGWETIRADIFDFDDDQAFLAVMEENHSRSDLLPLEEAKICADALTRFDAETVASRLGRSEKWVRRRAALHDLAPCWKHLAASPDHCDTLTIAHLEAVAKLEPPFQEKFLQQIEKRLPTMSPKDLRAHISALAIPFWPPWPQDDILADLDPCSQCRNRTSCTPALPGLGLKEEGDHCLDRECYQEKLKAWYNQELRRFINNLPYYKQELFRFYSPTTPYSPAQNAFSVAADALKIERIWYLASSLVESAMEPAAEDWEAGSYTGVLELDGSGEIICRVMTEEEENEEEENEEEENAAIEKMREKSDLQARLRKTPLELVEESLSKLLEENPALPVKLSDTEQFALCALILADDPDFDCLDPMKHDKPLSDEKSLIEAVRQYGPLSQDALAKMLLPALLWHYHGNLTYNEDEAPRLRQVYEVFGLDFDAALDSAVDQAEENQRLLEESKKGGEA
jgi:ParB/RepB/Spo0J family partition protein